MNGDDDMDVSGLDIPNFQSVDAVQRMISKLEKVKANMIQTGANGAHSDSHKTKSPSFDDWSILDMSEIQLDADEEWLMKPIGSTNIQVHESGQNEQCLENVRCKLLNHVKDCIKEEKDLEDRKQRNEMLARLQAKKCLSQEQMPRHMVNYSTSTITREKPNFAKPTLITTSPNRDNVLPLFPPPDVKMEQQPTVRPHHYLSPSGKQIDTRTYTRPKKNRKSLSVCEDYDPNSRSHSFKEDSILSHNSRSETGLNDTFNVNEDCNGSSTPLNASTNMSPTEHSSPRKVTRNLSYIIRRDSEGQVNNNCQPNGQAGHTASEPLNSTFTCSRDEQFLSSPSDSNNSLHNISMEELHNMARMQEQSLRLSSTPKTLTRKDTQTILELPNIDERPRPPGRTSSTDTYCVVQSNPDSAESSGLSSPLDAQSYEDIQNADAVRRSMPNLAVIKGANGLRGAMLQLVPPLNSLKHKAHHISDSKLSHFIPRSSLEQRTVSNPNSSIQYQNEIRRTGMSYQRPGLPYGNQPTSNGLRLPNNNSRSGLPTPRYSSIPSRDGNRALNPSSSRTSMLPTAASSTTTAYQQNHHKPQSARVQSRIPAPGAARSRQRITSARDGNQGKDVSDWRDGCY